jgi:hypothetical protein
LFLTKKIRTFVLNNKNMYVIIKHVKTYNKKRLPVILLNSESEIWEFDTVEEAENMRGVFELNSDSGHKYEVRKI